MLRTFERTGVLAAEHLAVLLLGVLLCASIAVAIGLHPMMGAFLFGTAVPRDDARELAHAVTSRLEAVSVQLLMPVFFVVTGLGVNIAGLGLANLAPALLVLAIACLGKFAGGAGAARALGLPTRQSLAIGTMMNTRGLAELVILNVGRSAGVLDDQMFTMLVVMAVVTTAMAGPIMRLVYRGPVVAERARPRPCLSARAANRHHATVVTRDMRNGHAMSTRSIAGDLTPDLLQTSVWSDEQLVSAGIPVVDSPFVTVGGGMGSFVMADRLRIAGVPTDQIRVLSNIEHPWQTYEYLTRLLADPAPRAHPLRLVGLPRQHLGVPGLRSARGVERQDARAACERGARAGVRRLLDAACRSGVRGARS